MTGGKVLGTVLILGAATGIGVAVYKANSKPGWQPGQPRPVGANGVGDVDYDGYVGPYDILVVERILLGLNDPLTGSPYTADQRRRADANGDGVVTVADVTKIERYYLGLDNTLPYARLTQAQQWGLLLKYHARIFHH